MRENLVQRQQRKLEEEKHSKFLGTARVHIQFLDFPSDPREGQRSKFRIDVLKERFVKEGCLHNDIRFRISAIVVQEQLDAAIQLSDISAATLMGNGRNNPPDLLFPTGTRIECLYGYHRVQAGHMVLPLDMRWWTVDLFRSGTVCLHIS
jgi:hypothetical protein